MKLADGGILGVRPPMRDSEATVDAAEAAGAEVALPPMELPGHGTCAIVIQGGIESGFWQL